MRLWRSVVIVAAWLSASPSLTDAHSSRLPQEVEGLLRVASIAAHESPAVQYLRQRR